MTTEVLESRRRSRDDVRDELRKLQDTVTMAQEQALLANVQLTAVNRRIDDLLLRLNRD